MIFKDEYGRWYTNAEGCKSYSNKFTMLSAIKLEFNIKAKRIAAPIFCKLFGHTWNSGFYSYTCALCKKEY